MLNDNYRLVLSADSSDLENGLKAIQAYMDALEKSNMDAPLDKFNDKLKQIAKEIKNVQNIQKKVEGTSFVKSKDMNDLVNSSKRAHKEINDLQNALNDVAESGKMKGLIDPKVIKTFSSLNNALKETSNIVDEVSGKSIGVDSDIKQRMRDMKDYGTQTKKAIELQKEFEDINTHKKQLSATQRRVSGTLDRTQSTNRMTYIQSEKMKADLSVLGSSKQRKTQTENRLNALRNEQQQARAQQQSIQGKASRNEISETERRKLTAEIQSEIQARSKTIQKYEELSKELDKSIGSFNKSQSEYQGRTVEARRGSFGSLVADRAPSIGSHAVMGALAPLTAMYFTGKGLSQQNRPRKIALGQQMGTNIDSVGTYMNEGIKEKGLGYDSGKTLEMAQQITSATGVINKSQVKGMVDVLASSSRSMGLQDEEGFRSTISDIQHTGAYKSSSSLSQFTDAVYGGIKQAGLEGRADEQIKALGQISQSVGRGRTLTDTDMNNVTAFQSTIAQSGKKSMQGQQGADLMTSLNEGIRGANSDPMLRNMMGLTDKYGGGITGWYNSQKQLEKGISDPENLTSGMERVMQQGSTEEEQRARVAGYLSELTQGNITTEQSDELFNDFKSGKLSKEEIAKKAQSMQESGKKSKDKNEKDYKESNEGSNNQNEANYNNSSEDAYNSKISQEIRDLSGTITGLGAGVTVLAGAVAGLTIAVAKSAGMMGAGQLFKTVTNRTQKASKNGKNSPNMPGGDVLNGTGKSNPKNPNSPKGGGFMGTLKGGFDTLIGRDRKRGSMNDPMKYQLGRMKERAKGTFQKAKGTDWKGKALKTDDVLRNFGGRLVNSGKDVAKGSIFSGLGQKAKNIFTNKSPNGIIAGAPSMGGLGGLGKVGGLLGKIAMPLGIAGSLFNVGSSVKGGSSLNDALVGESSNWIDPLGLGYGKALTNPFKDKSMKGKSLLGWNTPDGSEDFGLLGKAWNGIFGSDKEENKPGKGGGTLDGAKSDRNKNKKMSAEMLREKNNKTETENLKVYRSLLDRAERVLQDAKGLDKGGDSEGGSDDGSSASDVEGTGKKKIWNFLKKKGLSDVQVAGIMGNFEQESNLDPTATNPSSGAYGIAQWLGGRKSNLQAFAKSKGKKASDLDAQLDFLWHEMQGSEKGSLGRFNKAKTVEEATKYWAQDFERMGAGEAMMGKRIGAANKYKKAFAGGGGGNWNIPMQDSSLSNTPLSAFTSTTPNTSSSVNNNNAININITVEGSDDPKETATTIEERLNRTLSNNIDIFTNRHRRV